MSSHECGYVGLKKSRMLVCVCFEVEPAISTVFKLLKIVSSVFSQHSKYIGNVVIASDDIKEHCINNYLNSPVWKQFVFKQLLSKHLTMTRQ